MDNNQASLTELHASAEQLIKVSSTDMAEDVRSKVIDIDDRFDKIRTDLNFVLKELNDKLQMSKTFDRKLQDLLDHIFSYKENDTLKDISVGITTEEINQRLLDNNVSL